MFKRWQFWVGAGISALFLGLALPNHQRPGVIFIGANDDGTCANIPVTDELLRQLADMRSDGNILPIPTMAVEKMTLTGCDLAVVVVQPADAPPVRYKGQVWIRIVALQQLARNAVLHRTYEGTHAPVRIHWFSDRVEILSPGGPFGQVNRANFGRPGITDYRNLYLAEAMKNLGYVQRFGVGIQLARKELEKNGNPPPEFVVEDTYVLAMIRRRL